MKRDRIQERILSCPEEIVHEYENTISELAQQGIERSIGYVFLLYNAQKIVKEKLEKPLEILATLESAQNRLCHILNRNIDDKIRRHEFLYGKFGQEILTKKEKIELERLERERQIWNPYKAIKDLVIQEKNKIEYLSHDAFSLFTMAIGIDEYSQEFIKHLPSWRLSACRLLYEIWAQIKELRKGKKGIYTDIEKMKLVFAYHKIRTGDSEQSILFEQLKDDLSNFENFRKYQYNECTQKEQHKKALKIIHSRAVKTIYKRSFVDKIESDREDHLFLMTLWEKGFKNDKNEFKSFVNEFHRSDIPGCLNDEINKKSRRKKVQ